MAKFVQLTDLDDYEVVVNTEHISTVECPRSRDTYGKERKEVGSLITMVNTQRLRVKQSPAVVYLGAAS